jgi:hypothetical protein
VLLLPLAIPATLLAARWLGARGQTVVAVVGLALSATKLAALDSGDARAFAHGARALPGAATSAWLVSVDGPDHTACRVWLHANPHIRVADIYVHAGATPIEPIVRAHLARMHAEQRRVYLTWQAECELRRKDIRAGFPAAVDVLALLQREFTLLQIENDGVRAKEVQPRAGR